MYRIILDRKERIEENLAKIEKLESEINMLKPLYQSYTDILVSLAIEKIDIEEQLDQLQVQYNAYKDIKFLCRKSELIQSLTETVIKKQAKIDFAERLIESNNEYKSKVMMIVILFSTMRDGLKQYSIFKKDMKPSKSYIRNVLLKYEAAKAIIQLETESAIKKQRKDDFENKSIESNNEIKSKVMMIAISFHKNYKYLQQVAHEETHERVTFFNAISDYLKQYRIFKRDINALEPSKRSIEGVLLKYEVAKANSQLDVDKLISDLEERRRIIRSYPEKEKELRKSLYRINSHIYQVQSMFDVNLYRKKLQQLTEIEELNVVYQQQIDNLLNMSNSLEISKQKVKTM